MADASPDDDPQLTRGSNCEIGSSPVQTKLPLGSKKLTVPAPGDIEEPVIVTTAYSVAKKTPPNSGLRERKPSKEVVVA